MGNLPEVRVSPSPAFQKRGVDYAGPFTLRAIPARSKVTFKGYLCIFVCMVTRAIHLEIVSSLDTDSFIATLKRFVARRGKPTDIYSDQGTNFIGAEHELKGLITSDAHNATLAKTLANDGINWHFNPPGAPHMGGVWEAGVKTVKYHLKRVVGETRLTFEEITTLMAQIEACFNSRPLTPMSSDPNDFSALTPGHFLIGRPLLAIPEPNLQETKLNQLSRWQYLQRITQDFWKRWTNEHISRLQQRPKWTRPMQSIKIGDLVIIKAENFPPLHWKMGRVIKTHEGTDGLVRVVTLKTEGGEMQRPIHKLCLLPLDDESQAEIHGGRDVGS
ncbi:uncharacterized protein LOC110860106 [Folsomia candida]|uniref:uncharacterized protein LOC110860106 n=1 Tax=Folsomia candida TaxID=158441 RepID=UPI000B90367B|nr:uncharacterized protein LOC110860106 [Folsomia candida]